MSTVKTVRVEHPSGTGGVDIQATNTNDAAAAADVGYELITIIPVGSAVSLSTGVAKTIATRNIDPGNWEVSGNVIISFAGTPTYANGSINTSSDTLPASDTPSNGVVNTGHNVEGNTINEHVPILPMRVVLDVTTPYYLIGRAAFTSTAVAYGWIRAVRPR